MKRLGMFTGRIYEESEKNQILECCLVIPDGNLNDGWFVEEMREKNKKRCAGCYHCPEARSIRNETRTISL